MMRRTPGEYRANVGEMDVRVGAGPGVVMAGTDRLAGHGCAVVPAISAALATALLHASSRRQRSGQGASGTMTAAQPGR